MFKLVAEAYAVLSDPSQKAAYDAYGRAGLDPSGSGDGDGDADGWRGGSSFGSASSQAPRAHFPHVTAAFADDLFRSFFGGRDPFADFFGADPFSRAFAGGPFASMGFSMGLGGGGDLMSGFGAGGGFATFSSSTSSWSSSGGVGTSTSVQSRTTIEDGHRVTRTTRTVRHADGRVETSTDESRQPLALGAADDEYGRHPAPPLTTDRWASAPARRAVPVRWADEGAPAPAPAPAVSQRWRDSGAHPSTHSARMASEDHSYPSHRSSHASGSAGGGVSSPVHADAHSVRPGVSAGGAAHAATYRPPTHASYSSSSGTALPAVHAHAPTSSPRVPSSQYGWSSRPSAHGTDARRADGVRGGVR